MDKNEKVSVNMNIGTLSQIDLLVDQGFYSNRSDFINQAVRESLNQKQDRINAEKEKHDKRNFIWFLGVYRLQYTELIQIKENKSPAEGKVLGVHYSTSTKEDGQFHKKRISGYGMLYIDERLDSLVMETISEINVKGKVLCSKTIKERYGL